MPQLNKWYFVLEFKKRIFIFGIFKLMQYPKGRVKKDDYKGFLFIKNYGK